MATAALLIGFSVAPRLAAGSTFGESFGIGLDTRELPLGAIAFANDNGLRERMYNDFEIGSYLLFEPVGGYPRQAGVRRSAAAGLRSPWLDTLSEPARGTPHTLPITASLATADYVWPPGTRSAGTRRCSVRVTCRLRRQKVVP